jgi:methylphosphotriester-DNA--protein-cysteine methyltransferase
VRKVVVVLLLCFLIAALGSGLLDCKKKSISFDCDYIGDKNTKVFHKPSCSHLPDWRNRVCFGSRGEVTNAGYKPCGHCNP